MLSSTCVAAAVSLLLTIQILADEDEAVATPRPSIRALRAASKRSAIARIALAPVSPQSSPERYAASVVRKSRPTAAQAGKPPIALPRPSPLASFRV